ncbi:hypothetical protein, partial [Dysgonomonas sp. Marseille-P4677]|uniref:hypothetical protein n=1 Tax=Dysgonomonas sp. Marseille-P4677 TaxID=2364790 RepID=UPI001F21A475
MINILFTFFKTGISTENKSSIKEKVIILGKLYFSFVFFIVIISTIQEVIFISNKSNISYMIFSYTERDIIMQIITVLLSPLMLLLILLSLNRFDITKIKISLISIY